jgi:malate dehydrogenase (quinone)
MIGDPAVKEPDVVLVGAGIMSATLAVCLKELEPSLNIEMFETLGGPALESSNAWNNAGTGHAANCELNYTPERSDGSIDISEALRVNVEFDLSRQLWGLLAFTLWHERHVEREPTALRSERLEALVR